MKKGWTATGWRIDNSQVVNYTLFLPAHVCGYLHKDMDGDHKWYWWNGSARAYRPTNWPGNGPFDRPEDAAKACEESMLWELAGAIAVLTGKPDLRKRAA